MERYRALAAELEAALRVARADPSTPPRDIAGLAASINRTLWHLGKLTGEAELTMPMIARSSAWREFSARLEQVLSRHPAAAADIAKLFASLAEGGAS